MRTKEMNKKWITRGLKFVFFAVLFITLFGFVVMRLWNWLTPAIFGWHGINFWQAVGLLVLSKILFGGFHGRAGQRWYWVRLRIDGWDQVPPEERDHFRQAMRSRGVTYAAPAATPKA